MTESQPEPQPWDGGDDYDLGSGRVADPREIAAEIKASLGIGVPRVRYRPGGLADRPDISALAEGLGLK